jgi:tRNA threonylcarbamoyladenosine biosynthesis protein TsaB
MLLLAADTSGKFGSIALARCSVGDACNILEVVPLEGGTFSAQLVPQMASLLSKHGYSKQDLGAFAVVSGPGSFTGLRVGLAAIKALAEILAKPIVAVSLLDAIAVAGSGKVLAVLDAGRGEVYVGEYEVGFTSQMNSERLLSRAEMLASTNQYKIITPDSSIVEFVHTSGKAVSQIERPKSDAIARLAWRKLSGNQTISPDVLDANYIRRSDAEIFSSR